MPWTRKDSVELILVSFHRFKVKLLEISVFVLQYMNQGCLRILLHDGRIARDIAAMYPVHHEWFVDETHLGVAFEHLQPHHPVFFRPQEFLESEPAQYLFRKTKAMRRHREIDVPLQQQVLIREVVLR